MPEAFKFLDQLVDSPAGLLTTARQMLNDTHRLTNASDPTKIPLADVRRHVTNVVLEAANERLRAPLTEEIDRLFSQAQAEYEVIEGDLNPDEERPVELMLAMVQALEGSDVEHILGEDHLTSAVLGGGWAGAIADAVLAALVADPRPVLERLGVGPGDLEALVVEARTPRPATAPVEDLAADIRKDDLARLAIVLEPGDPMNTEIVTCVLSGDPDLLDTAFMLAAFSDADQALLRRIATDRIGVTTPDDNARDLAEVMRALAPTADAALPAAPAVTAEPDKPKRGRAPSVDPSTLVHTDMTHATRGMVVALCENTAATEQEVADTLGVTKSQMIRIRKGAEVHTPTNPDNLRALLISHKEAIDAALVAFEQAMGFAD
jgi:hypothetical protein